MRLFVSANYKHDRHRARRLAERLRAKGHTIAEDWWWETAESREQAEADIVGVRSADAVVVLADHRHNYRGVYAEIGAALSHNIPVYIIGDIGSIFRLLCHPFAEFPGAEEIHADC